MTFTSNNIEEYITSNNMIYIDACSLRKKGMPKFYNNVKQILRDNDKKIVIPEKVCKEIKKYSIDGYEDALRAEKYVNKMIHHNLAVIKHAEDYEISHADHGIKADFNKYYVKNKMLLISNDYDLAMDILAINVQKSVVSKYLIEVVKITKEGYLEPYQINENVSGRKYNYSNNIFNNNRYKRSRYESNLKKSWEDIFGGDNSSAYFINKMVRNIYR